MKRTTHKIIIAIFVASFSFFQTTQAADATAPAAFVSAKSEIENMLAGNTPLSYERAIFLTENAYHKNELSEKDFSELIAFHTDNIRQLIKANSKKTVKDFTPTLLKSSERQLKEYEAALANYAIFLYMTDTTFFLEQNKVLYHLPYIYSNQDPLGTLDFTNTQVNKLLYSEQQEGNCFALTSLFKIFSERLGSNAIICTAPGHVYIRHADDRGIYHNVELGSKSFPGTGSISVITYTTDQALKSDISLRELDLKQSVGLCLIYLAKGYEHQTNSKASDFAFDCAELALKYDSLNLNAILLKAEVLEARLLAKNKSVAQLQSDKQFQQYQKLLVHLFDLGYREMPSEQKRMIIEKLRNPEMMLARVNDMQQQAKQKSYETRTATLSWGLFDEEMRTKPVEVFGRTAFSSSTKKISKFLPVDTATNYPIDLIVFAWCVDPLAAKYPSISPYAAFGNNPIIYVDNDGRENIIYLVVLPSSNTSLQKGDAQKIADQATANFKNMGLKTEVRIVESKGFDINKIDAHDAVAVLGSRDNVVNYVAETLHDKGFADNLNGIGEKRWEGGSDNPERSKNDGGASTGNIIAIDATGLKGFAGKVGINDESEPTTKAGALTISHGGGHNSGLYHAYDNTQTTTSVIMSDADRLGGILSNENSSYPKYADVTNNQKGQNADYVKAMKGRFGNENAKDHYSDRIKPAKK